MEDWKWVQQMSPPPHIEDGVHLAATSCLSLLCSDPETLNVSDGSIQIVPIDSEWFNPATPVERLLV